MSKEVMAECLEEAIRLLAPYCASQSQVVLVHLDVIATIAVALYQERMREIRTKDAIFDGYGGPG